MPINFLNKCFHLINKRFPNSNSKLQISPLIFYCLPVFLNLMSIFGFNIIKIVNPSKPIP